MVILSDKEVSEVRYNVGARSPLPPYETLEYLNSLCQDFGKKLWIDLKGRQLRIAQWAVPTYGDILLNHEIELEFPARIYFRNDDSSEITHVSGNQIYIDPPPKHAVGMGQAVNIHAKNLNIKGYLTIEDMQYLVACNKLGIKNIMASFVESMEDIEEIQEYLLDANIVLKIESAKGLEFVRNTSQEVFEKYHLMAARDDMYINTVSNKANILKSLEMIIEKDKEAILASHLFASLEKSESVMLSDYSDVRLMQLMGYKNFMLSDGVSNNHFNKAIQAWVNFKEIMG